MSRTHEIHPTIQKQSEKADNAAVRVEKTYSAAFDLSGLDYCSVDKDYSLAFDYNGLQFWLYAHIGMPTDERLELEAALDDLEKRFGKSAREAFARRAAISNANSFAKRLSRMRLAQRREALKEYYAEGDSWAKVRGEEPTPAEFLAWLDIKFPDRRIIGLRYGDMEHLDHEAFLKLKNWRSSESQEVLAAVAKFGLPTKQESFDPETAVKDAPTSRQVRDAFLSGDPDAPVLERKRARAQYHAVRR